MNAQLAALADVTAAFDAAGIDHWLFGGWAVDFHAGEVLRPHEDLDLAIRHADLVRIDAVLTGDGWHHAPDPDEDGGTGYERDGVRVELTFLERWPVDVDGAEVLEFAGVACPVVSRESLLRSRADAAEPKWRADYEALRALPPRPDRARPSSSR